MTKTIMIRNGSSKVPYKIYSCCRCGKEIGESEPREVFEANVYCGDCAFILGKITEKELLQNHYFSVGEIERAIIHNGEVYFSLCKKFPWERNSRDRECKEYKEWRISVFSRDNYTCQNCGQVGGVLNAHHIKSYKDYPRLRYSLKNGLTLCEKCHRKVHRKKRVWYE